MTFWTRFLKWCRKPEMIKVHTFNPSLGRIELIRGAKTGAVSGIIFGVLLGSILNIGLNIIYNMIHGHLEYYMTSLITEPPLAPIMVYIIFGVIGGLIFGLIFALLYDKLPGKTPKSKGIMTSLIFWGATVLGFPALINLCEGGFEGLYWFVISSFYWEQAVIGLGSSAIWGWLIGHFWARGRISKL